MLGTTQATVTTTSSARTGSFLRIRPGRTRRLLSVLAVGLPLLVATLGTPVATADDLSDAIARQKAIQARIAEQKRSIVLLTQRQVGVRASIARATKTLNGINANLADVRGQVRVLTADIALTKASFSDLANQLGSIDAQLQALQNEEVRRQKALVKRKALLAERIRSAYATGNTTLLETFLTAGSFNDALSEAGYYLDVGVQDLALARQITQDVRDIAELHQIVMGTRVDTEE